MNSQHPAQKYERLAEGMGHRIVTIFVMASVALHWYYLGFGSLISLRFVGFTVVGVLTSLLVIGPVGYWLYVTTVKATGSAEQTEIYGFVVWMVLNFLATIFACFLAFRWFYLG